MNEEHIFPGRSRRVRRLGGSRLLTVLTVLTLLAAACGGGAESGGGDAGGEEIDLAAFCEGAIEGEARFTEGPETDDQGNPTEESLEDLRNDVSEHIEAIEQNAPEEIEDEVGVVVDGVRSALETGDEEATQAPEFVEAETVLDEYVYENCEVDAQQEFAAVDYAYEGVPSTLEAGQIAFRMDNRGTEVHEAIFFRIADNEQRSMQQILELPEEQGQQLAEFRAATFSPPGSPAYVVADLDAGRYAMVCFIPVGTTSLEQLQGPESGEEASPGASPTATGAASPEASPTSGSPAPGAGGEQEGQPPHFTRGMIAEFTVG